MVFGYYAFHAATWDGELTATGHGQLEIARSFSVMIAIVIVDVIVLRVVAVLGEFCVQDLSMLSTKCSSPAYNLATLAPSVVCPSLEQSFGRLHGPLASKMLVATLFSASRLKISLIEAVKILIKQQLNIQDFCPSTKEDPRRASCVYVVQDKVSGPGFV